MQAFRAHALGGVIRNLLLQGEVRLRGVSGKITVNGKEYNSVMPAVALNDEQTANVLTYILNSWGNAGGQVTPAEVATERKAK